MHNKNETTVNPYITFDGNCKEAMEFYKQAVDGELEIMPFDGSPVEVPENYKDRILHSTLKFGAGIVMASDGMPGQAIEMGNSMSISIAVPEEKLADNYFENLSKGGIIIMPYERTFWGAKFGMFKDRFGVNWMINCEIPE